MTAEMKPVDVLEVIKDAIRRTSPSSHFNERANLWAAYDAVAELIERDKAAAKVFDCVLRGLNDLTGAMGYRSQEFVSGWLENWSKSMHAAGFKPTDPTAPDIARALARIGGAQS